MVKKEISIMRTLNHPNIVQLYQVMANKNKIYLVMEYVNGGTVCQKRRLADLEGLSKVEENTWRRYFQQLISAVDFCHRKGIYHRDIKSDNLLLDDRGNLKLADFGLSTFQEHVGRDSLFHSAYGIPYYLAPEVLSGDGYAGAPADIWSCGIILYEIFVGDIPFHYDNDLSPLCQKIWKGDYSCPTRLPSEVRELLFRLLDPNPLTRITMPEIMDDPWFKVGFNGNNLSLHYHDSSNNMNISGHGVVDFPNSPCMNAFSVLASWPTGLDLAPLFADSKGLLRFMSKQPVSAIISKFQEVATANGFNFKRREWTVNMEGTILGLEAKIFEVSPSLYAVDVSNTGGDTAEYKNFRDHHMIPALQDIGWAWRVNHCNRPVDEKEQKNVTPKRWAWQVNHCNSLEQEQKNVTEKREKKKTAGIPILPFLMGLMGFACTFTLMSLRAWANHRTVGSE
jgi:5'-AMP-activated protein kinase catalytic alpha subunit